MKRSPREGDPAPPDPGDGAPGGTDEPPPVLGSWTALYALVIAGLLVMIAVCAAITRWAP